ncbi:hypothetical protein PV10_00359 [Exophiala mesophila]|uniref:Transcription factor Rba50 n=1 Tax=Exophiala mesophila TaxID=212818 RepID=A0A0D1ZPK4_EXOME|nr:uncharacterized protein PV10_00359 [Exophiala mesophila]KIV96497.1 hypothetical protein PV10_00359 [Exophiala mesophila]
MAARGQRFELDLDADDFAVNILNGTDGVASSEPPTPFIKEIQEHDIDSPPPAPSFKSHRSGFPEHKPRPKVSSFKQRQQASSQSSNPFPAGSREPSDRAIINHLGKKYGHAPESREKAEISEENNRRIAQMSVEEIEQARAELMANLNPMFVDRLLKKANLDDESTNQAQWPGDEHDSKPSSSSPAENNSGEAESRQTHLTTSDVEEPPTAMSSVHFPHPPRSADDYVPLNTNDNSFLSDLKTHYFPELSHDPASLSWMQDPTEEENAESLYNPSKESFLPSALRFGFNGRLIAPKESLEIDVKKGLHHHGDAPSSAGYTIPELSLLARSTLPNQRCLAYQVLGRILYRLGQGGFGPRGGELQEAMWSVIEREKPIEVMMSEANRLSGHSSAKSHATEALWLWKKGGGGDRGILKPGQNLAK